MKHFYDNEPFFQSIERNKGGDGGEAYIQGEGEGEGEEEGEREGCVCAYNQKGFFVLPD